MTRGGKRTLKKRLKFIMKNVEYMNTIYNIMRAFFICAFFKARGKVFAHADCPGDEVAIQTVSATMTYGKKQDGGGSMSGKCLLVFSSFNLADFSERT